MQVTSKRDSTGPRVGASRQTNGREAGLSVCSPSRIRTGTTACFKSSEAAAVCGGVGSAGTPLFAQQPGPFCGQHPPHFAPPLPCPHAICGSTGPPAGRATGEQEAACGKSFVAQNFCDFARHVNTRGVQSFDRKKHACARSTDRIFDGRNDSTCSASKVGFHGVGARRPPSIVKKPPTFISVEHTVTIAAPISDVFERWQRIEDYPRFMEGVREISWLDESAFGCAPNRAGSSTNPSARWC
jgi:hypothetical protein